MEAVLIALVVFAFLLIVFLVLAFRFPDDLKKLLGRTESVEVTRKGVVIRLVTEAVTEKESRRPDPTEVRDLIEDIPAGRRLLWVDDAPSNNSREIQALRALDFTVDTATTNAEALTYAGNGYDLVLSDIGRGQPEAETPA